MLYNLHSFLFLCISKLLRFVPCALGGSGKNEMGVKNAFILLGTL